MMPEILTSRDELQEWRRKLNGRSVGFVPTMGALHTGHLSLLQESKRHNDATLLSIFVNPTQFGPNEDFGRYPRTFEADVRLAQEAGVDAVYAPTVADMYPSGFATSVKVSGLDEGFCGPFRPGHFQGVSTVVLMLLNLAQAQNAYFGRKDFQQLAIIQRMVRDLGHPTRIVGVPTLRESDGLALSSRNRYLSPEGRLRARVVPQSLAAAAALWLGGERGVDVLLKEAREVLQANGFTPQYLELRDATSLVAFPLDEGAQLEGDAVMALAQPLVEGQVSTRLIDNIVFSPEESHFQSLQDLVNRVQNHV